MKQLIFLKEISIRNVFNKSVLLFALLVMMTACEEKEEKEDLVQNGNINKEGAVETAILIDHLSDEFDIVVTTHKVWYKGNEYRTFTHTDTMPSLGKTQVSNNNGQTAIAPKEYESYITVK